MSIKKLLYFDDNKIPSQIGKLRSNLKNQGFDLDEKFLYLGDETFKKRNDKDEVVLDKEKIRKFIIDNYVNDSFDIVASDYDFRDSSLDGYELLKWLKNESDSKKYRIRRAKFCLYSAEQDRVVKIFDTPEKIKGLIKLKIDDFIGRENIPQELTQIFVAPKKKFQFKESLISYLEKHTDEKFLSVYPKFRGMTLGEIAHEIDKDLPNGIEFQKNLMELTIAHLIDLNDFEK